MLLNKILKAAALTAIACALMGCGTLFSRLDNRSAGDIYPGLQQDGAFLGLTGTSETYNPSGAVTILCYLTVVCIPITLLSVPVDAAIDTVLLPIDLINAAEPEPHNR